MNAQERASHAREIGRHAAELIQSSPVHVRAAGPGWRAECLHLSSAARLHLRLVIDGVEWEYVVCADGSDILRRGQAVGAVKETP